MRYSIITRKISGQHSDLGFDTLEAAEKVFEDRSDDHLKTKIELWDNEDPFAAKMIRMRVPPANSKATTAELAMFGVSQAEIDETIKEQAEQGDCPLFVALGILSDAQTLNGDAARRRINVAKYILSETRTRARKNKIDLTNLFTETR